MQKKAAPKKPLRKKALSSVRKTKATKKITPKSPKKLLYAKAATKKVVKKKYSAAKKPKLPSFRELALSAARAALTTGDVAPDFTLPSTHGGDVSLVEYRGKTIVLYFYPKDMTAGCTIEAAEFTAVAEKFSGRNIVLFGVSPDTIASHEKFIAKEGITFPLLADVDHRVAEAYGVWKEKSMYGNTYMGIERTTFVIGPDGKIARVYSKVKPEGHAVCVLNDVSRS